MSDEVVAAGTGVQASKCDEYVVAGSDCATTCEERVSRSRTTSSMSFLSEPSPITTNVSCNNGGCSDYDVAAGGAKNALPVDDEDAQRETSLYPPTIAPLHPSLAAMSLHSLEAVPETQADIQLPAVATLPIHRIRSASDLLFTAREFSALSAPKLMRLVCKERVPGWQHVDVSDINVDQILSGLSNQLYKVNIREDYPERARFAHPEVLFRIYGKDVNSLYDSSTEVCVFKILGVRGVAPRLIAELDGGRIEEWINGAALLHADMAKSSVLLGLAGILAGIHQIDLSKYIDTRPCIEKFLNMWRAGAMAIYDSVTEDHPSYLALQRLNLPKLAEESYKLHNYLFPEGCPETVVTRLTFCHNDMQENNIMVTHNCMRLIDFEYSGYNYPAYDIASYFWEMTCDYCVPAYPFFHIDPTRYPLIEKRRLFAAMYLSRLTGTHVKTSCIDQIDPLLDAVERFQLAAHMLWSFWSVIRAPQAVTATEFDMLYYAQKRVDCYWTHKAKLMAEGKLQAA